MAIPVHEPDEKLFSWLARAELAGGFADARAASTAFWGYQTAGLKLDFPSHLDQFVARTPNLLGNVDCVVQSATHLPYLARFRPQAAYDLAILQMRGPSVAHLKFHLGLHGGSQSVRSPLRLCPICYEEERCRIGMAYWHRVHQLPGVVVCPEHGERLWVAMADVQDKQPRLFLPEDFYSTCTRPLETPPPGAHTYAVRLAVLSRAALNLTLPGGFQEKALFHTYRHGLKSSGFLSRTGRIRVSSLRNAMSGNLPQLPEGVQLGRAGTDRQFELLLSILRGEVASHPVPHLVLIDFLFGAWETFCSVYAWEQAMHATEKSDQFDQVLDAVHAFAVAAKTISVGEGKNGKASHAVKQTRHRSALLECMKARPTLSRSQLEEQCAASWKWLYRNDRVWLESKLPAPLPKGRYYGTWVDWEDRDRQLSMLVSKYSEQIRFESTERITPVTILRKLPSIGFSIQLNKLPQSRQLVEHLVNRHKNRRAISVR